MHDQILVKYSNYVYMFLEVYKFVDDYSEIAIKKVWWKNYEMQYSKKKN